MNEGEDTPFHGHRSKVGNVRHLGGLGVGSERVFPPPEQHQKGDPAGQELRLQSLVSDPASQGQPSLVQLLDLLVRQIFLAAQVVVRAQGGAGGVMFQRQAERVAEQRHGPLSPSHRPHDEGLGVQRLRQELGEEQLLGDGKSSLDEIQRLIGSAEEEGKPRDLSAGLGDLGARRVLRQHLVRKDQTLQRLLETPVRCGHERAPDLDPGLADLVAQLVGDFDGSVVQLSPAIHEAGVHGHVRGPGQEIRLQHRFVRELVGLLEVGEGRPAGRQGLRTGPGLDERVTGLRLYVHGVRGIRRGPVRLEVMRRQDLGDLELLACPLPFEESGHGQVAGLAVALGERLVRHPPHQVLEERVLPSLRRAGVGLDAQYLLAHQRRQVRLDGRLVASAHRGDRRHAERLADDRGILEQGPLLRREPVQPGRDERVKRLGDRQVLDGADRAVHTLLFHEQPTVEQHANRFHRVERHTFRAIQDRLAHRIGQTGDQPVEQLLHVLAAQRLEVHRRHAAPSRRPRREPVGDLRPGQRHDEDGEASRPVQQVLDEVEQRGVGPLEVLEDHHHRVALRDPLEEPPPRPE